MAITKVEDVDLSSEIQDWKDAVYGREVREANVSAFKKIQTQVNKTVRNVNEAAVGIEQIRIDAEAARDNAKTYANNAANSATAASTSASNAKTSETNAKTSETNAGSSATAAKTSETNAASSASTASAKATAAATSETNAKKSETNAASSASTASAKATAAATSETNAKTYANNASSSATAASTSAANALASETAASQYKDDSYNAAISAQASEKNASTSAKGAATSASNAKTSETNASNSATAASTKASEAATSATAAKTSETNATSSATAAKTSETNIANVESTVRELYRQTGIMVDTCQESVELVKTNAERAETAEANASVNAAAAENAYESASLSEQNAASSANIAKSYANDADLYAGNASKSATAASTSASNAKTSETNASNSASTATSKANAAATSATNASNSATAASMSEANVKKYADMLKNMSFICVTAYGAIGDGVTDDTNALQAALNAKGAISLEGGKTYLISSELQIKSDTFLYGNGATIKVTSNFASKTNIIMARNLGRESTVGGYNQNQNIIIHGLKFDFSNIIDLGGIGIGHAHNVTIRDCEFYNFASWHPIELNSCNGGLIDGCYFHDGCKAGAEFAEIVQIDGAYGVGVFELSPYDNTVSKNISVINCRFEVDPALHNTRAYYPVCIGSHWTYGEFHENILIENNICNGAQTFVGAHNWKNVRIANNVCKNIRMAVYTWMWDQLDICDNNFIFSTDAMLNNATDRGVYTNAENATFDGNGCTTVHGSVSVKNNRFENTASHTICLSGSTCIIEGNHICGSRNAGIYASWLADKTIVMNNYVTGSAGAADIYINCKGGTSPVTYVVNNVCDSLKGTGIGNSLSQSSVVANNLITKTKSLYSSFKDTGNILLT